MQRILQRTTSLAIVAALTIPVQTLAAVPQFQDVMKGYGPTVANAPADARPPVQRKHSIRYDKKQRRDPMPAKAPARAAQTKKKTAAVRQAKADKIAPGEPAPAVQVIVTLPALPFDLDEFGGFMLPGDIVEALPRPIIVGVIAAQAKDYLIRTATTGGTMMRYGRLIVGKRLKAQGLAGKALAGAMKDAERSGEIERVGKRYVIEMLHDVFAIRLARSVKQGRNEGIPGLGIFSAYRGPELGVGGFGDKTQSSHAGGIGVDMAGIDSAKTAAHWQRVANANGLYLPYGPNNRAERNHTQLLMIAKTSQLPPLHKIIREAARTREPVQDRVALWKASGVKIDAMEPVEVVQLAYFGGRRKTHFARHHHRIHHRRYAAA